MNRYDYINKYKKYTKGNILDWASEHNKIDAIIEWNKIGIYLPYSCNAMDLASKNNNIEILQWWLDYGEFEYSENAINWASNRGHVNVLEWWKNSGLLLKYNGDAISDAFMNGHENVLDWWLYSELEIKCDYLFIEKTNMIKWIHLLELHSIVLFINNDIKDKKLKSLKNHIMIKN